MKNISTKNGMVVRIMTAMDMQIAVKYFLMIQPNGPIMMETDSTKTVLLPLAVTIKLEIILICSH